MLQRERSASGRNHDDTPCAGNLGFSWYMTRGGSRSACVAFVFPFYKYDSTQRTTDSCCLLRLSLPVRSISTYSDVACHVDRAALSTPMNRSRTSARERHSPSCRRPRPPLRVPTPLELTTAEKGKLTMLVFSGCGYIVKKQFSSGNLKGVA